MAAFEHIYRRFEHAAYTLALRLCGRADVAEQVLQDGMLKAFEQARQYRGTAPFGAWLRKLVLNEALMHLRRERKQPTLPFEDAHPDERADEPWRHADAATLEQALMQLPDTARTLALVVPPTILLVPPAPPSPPAGHQGQR